jgi:hypothetical protein
MTALLLTPDTPFDRLRRAAPQLVALTAVLLFAAVPVALAMAIDTRSFNGESIWLKPLKFHIALALYTGTLAIYALALPEGTLVGRNWRRYQAVVVAAIVAEVVWIGGAAALGTGSHFNTTIPGLYPAMGAAAVILTSISLAMGLAFWRVRTSALHLGLATGLVLTFVLTVIVAGTMSSSPGHHVGTPVTGARLPLMGWSGEVGDLRVAHFFATHAMHAVPLAGLSGSRRAVWITAAAYTALVVATYVQALMGLPLVAL